jgi:diaminopimelate decarboxylase
VTTPAPRGHAPHPYFTVGAEGLTVGGRTLSELAASVGRTPFYAYERAAIDKRIREVRAALPPEVHLHYAMKANPLPEVVSHIASRVEGLDVASVGELRVALATGTTVKEISFAGPGKTDAELEEAARAGILINVESERELAVLSRLAPRLPAKPRVAIRVNPDFELKTSGMKMGGGPKPFGIDAERVPEVLAALARMPLEFEGFHIFSGSQNLQAAAITEAQRNSVTLAARLASAAPAPVRVLNLGGGFGIPYFPGELPLDLAAVSAGMHELVAQRPSALRDAVYTVELGRYLTGEAGIYVCRVIDRKISRGQVFLVTDGGLHHHLAASGNFGQVLRKNYPVVVGTRPADSATEVASVVGPLCTPLDLLADRAVLSRAEPGDLIVVLQSGAYGRSASPLGFLSHPAPAEILV